MISFLSVQNRDEGHCLKKISAMSENNGTKILLAFVAGAAIGAAIGYFLNSDKKDEIFNELKDGASRLKNDLEENLSKAKDLVDNFRDNTETTTENSPK